MIFPVRVIFWDKSLLWINPPGFYLSVYLASFFARSQFTLCILTMLRSMHSATGDLADSSRRRNWYHNHWNYHRGLLATDPVPRGEWVWSIVVTWLYLALGICWVQELGKESRKRAIHSELHNDQWYLWQLLSHGLSSLSLFSVVTIHYSFHRTPVTKTLATWRNGIDQSNHSLPPSPPTSLTLPYLTLSRTLTHVIAQYPRTRILEEHTILIHLVMCQIQNFWLIFLHHMTLFMYVDQKFCLTSRKFCCAGDTKSNIAS